MPLVKSKYALPSTSYKRSLRALDVDRVDLANAAGNGGGALANAAGNGGGAAAIPRFVRGTYRHAPEWLGERGRAARVSRRARVPPPA
ncbi:hypothetical protein [Burkholderia sp. MSMB617WGS]|uniref:hypothetical protein n=1 Tax=Burkholderia sp. MSMB617WGS TaxID=1637831 RepID=UPI000AC3E05C|nr:hypothetical protein [Burkholderia sp. MSMB617WGS]